MLPRAGAGARAARAAGRRAAASRNDFRRHARGRACSLEHAGHLRVGQPRRGADHAVGEAHACARSPFAVEVEHHRLHERGPRPAAASTGRSTAARATSAARDPGSTRSSRAGAPRRSSALPGRTKCDTSAMCTNRRNPPPRQLGDRDRVVEVPCRLAVDRHGGGVVELDPTEDGAGPHARGKLLGGCERLGRELAREAVLGRDQPHVGAGGSRIAQDLQHPRGGPVAAGAATAPHLRPHDLSVLGSIGQRRRHGDRLALDRIERHDRATTVSRGEDPDDRAAARSVRPGLCGRATRGETSVRAAHDVALAQQAAQRSLGRASLGRVRAAAAATAPAGARARSRVDERQRRASSRRSCRPARAARGLLHG